MQNKGNIALFLTAAIWGFAFVAQRVGMEHVEPFIFNGIRFGLGSFSLLPLIWYYGRRPGKPTVPVYCYSPIWSGLIAGLILFVAASLQQIGVVYTTAGKAAFITCMYLIMVPIAGLFLKHRITMAAWLGSALAVAGLYFLCVKEDLTVSFGDVLVLGSALFWTVHILYIDHISNRVDVLKLACVQFAICSVFSLTVAAAVESPTVAGIEAATVPILYGGLCSVGIAYTLQIVGQKYASPTHASIILSLETVFAAIGGYLILDEQLGSRELLGCALMLGGMLLSQMKGAEKENR
jgi:drug/metabolite transporter (DMT)-like permease